MASDGMCMQAREGVYASLVPPTLGASIFLLEWVGACFGRGAHISHSRQQPLVHMHFCLSLALSPSLLSPHPLLASAHPP
jgi:hypothetical protein